MDSGGADWAPMDECDEPLPDDVWDFADTSDYDALIADLDRLDAASDFFSFNRRLRRDRRVGQAADALRVATKALWIEGDSPYGTFESPNAEQWDKLLPVADQRLNDAVAAVEAMEALTVLLLALAASEPAPEPAWPTTIEPRPPTPVERHEPDLALAPPLPAPRSLAA